MASLIDLLIQIKDIFFFPGNFLESMFIGLSNIPTSSPASEVKAFLLKIFVKVFFFGGFTIWIASMLFWSVLVISIPKIFIFPRIKDFVFAFLSYCMAIASIVSVGMGIYTSLYLGGGVGLGGGGTYAPVTSTESFPLMTVFRNIFTSSSSNKFTISGTAFKGEIEITGSGTVTNGNLSAGTFEGLPALQRTVTLKGSFVSDGETTPLTVSCIEWVDLNYVPKGESCESEYVVVTGTPTIPTVTRVNDTGTLYTANRYESSTKEVLLGTKSVTYVIETDTTSTALLTLFSVEKSISNVETKTISEQFRITPTGTFTRIKDTVVIEGIIRSLTLNFKY